jgi:phosphatidylglycerol:prolipoprotein diacylglycerol transferase
MLPVLFHLGPIPVRAYGVFVLLGFLLGLRYALWQIRRRPPAAGQAPITAEHIFDFSVIGLLSGIIGARLLYVLLDLGTYMKNPGEVLKLWSGGLTIVGGLLAGMLWAWWFCRKRKLQFLQLVDRLIPSFALAYAVGRIGCFLNGCCYGTACDLPWAVRFQTGSANGWTEPSHPAQLYSTIANLAFFGLLHWRSQKPYKPGEIFYGYLVLYCLYRFADEIVRKGASAEVLAYGLTQAQTAMLAALPVVAWLYWRSVRGPSSPRPS